MRFEGEFLAMVEVEMEEERFDGFEDSMGTGLAAISFDFEDFVGVCFPFHLREVEDITD